ncbi:hypothetical protein BP6252_14056 [Coleophoma cylindrospora]|uniref:beta-glucosidase n=1 Tax=Coleophoma cylindrospora TaxID=1849047 RepID=A0A3D8Q4S6_9HELO|nr:hypothetical protein BP6252_14056 [Coleophoma cylindrospora]
MTKDSSENGESQIADLLRKLTMEEKLSFLSGANMWETFSVPRLQIGHMKMTDGPAGARGKTWTSGSKSALIPCGPSLGATWSDELLTEVGMLLGQECIDKRSHILLAPNLNIHRSPLGGRMFENYSEDPYLVGILAAAEVRGIQAMGVGAVVKHFVGNEQESRRFNIDEKIDERTLREVYLKPFQMVVEAAKPWALMTSYNKVNGEHMDESHLLKDVVRDEWKWDGMVISDWGGTNSLAKSLNAGTDLEMPGPPVRRKMDRLLLALQDGEIQESVVDDSVTRILRAAFRTGRLGQESDDKDEEETSVDRLEHRQLLRRTACESLVLLKNNGILPLAVNTLRRIAIIGPNAKVPTAGGSGSATVAPHYMSTPYQSLVDLAKGHNGDVEIDFAQGMLAHKLLPLLGSKVKDPETKAEGLTLTFYEGYGCQGEARGQRYWSSTNIFMMSDGDIPDNLEKGLYSFRAAGVYTCASSGNHTFGLSSVGQSKLYIDDVLIVDNSAWTKGGGIFMNCGSEEVRGSIYLEENKEYKLEIYQDATPPPLQPNDNTLFPFISGLRVGCLPPIDEDAMMAEAVSAASKADVAILIIGHNNDWEREGVDREDMALPGRSEELIHAVCRSNPKTIVVNQSGCPISMVGWVEAPAAIIQAWYQGQENGNALADVILGNAYPSGKLPITFPKYLEHHGSFKHFPGDVENDQAEYKEGLQVGYKWFDAQNIDPLFEFGFGLSYTSFSVKLLSIEGTISQATASTIKVAVENIGPRAGAEVVQVYVAPYTENECFMKNLQAFKKVYVEAGEEKRCELQLGSTAVQWFDPEKRTWRVDKGKYHVCIGVSSRKIVSMETIEVTESWEWV